MNYEGVLSMTEEKAPPRKAPPAGQPGGRLRVKILGGDLTADQWRTLAAVATEFTPLTPLHLTTRQDIEFHDVRPEQITLVQDRLLASGLTGKPSCGDTVRNITVCPCSGVCPAGPDLRPLARQIRTMLEEAEGPLALPRKFKVSLSACPEACGQPWINDVGLVAIRRAGGRAFRVIVAGSLGARPLLGMVLDEQRPPDEVLPLTLALLRVFAAHGNRKNRAVARLRHVRQEMGDELFTALVQQAFQAARAERRWPAVDLPEVTRPLEARRMLTFPDGNLSAAAAEALAVLADRSDTVVRIDNHHRVVLAGQDEAVLRDALAGFPSLEESARPQPAIVACPGRRWCKNGLTDTAAVAEQIRRELTGQLPPETVIGISGCPNNCSHSAVAPVGLVGTLVSEGGQRREAYNLYVGGDLGRSDRLAIRTGGPVTVPQAIERLAASLCKP
jgi:sulfite reductase beta subunit-like hemoprotein